MRSLPSTPSFVAAMTLIASWSVACTRADPSRANELSFLEVELLSDIAATEESPNPFTPSPIPVSLRVQALDRQADPLEIDIDLSASVRPGIVGTEPDASRKSRTLVPLVGGRWEGEVSIRSGFGPTRIWFADEDTQTDTREPTYATGVSDAIHFALPTLVELQTTDDHETNPLEREFAEVRTADRKVVVTHVGTNGIFVTDLDSPPGGFNGLYIYTFSKPTDGIVQGSRLELLTGIDQEYLAATQLSIPVYPSDEGPIHTVPDAITLSADQICAGDASDPEVLEPFEGSFVRIEKPTIPADFKGGSCETADPDSDFGRFCEYGQWPIMVGKCRLFVVSSADADDFYPPDYAGQSISFVQGMLTAYWAESIILLRSFEDVGLGQVQARPSIPHSSPRKNIFHR